MEQLGHYINGQAVSGRGQAHSDVFNPATGEVTAQLDMGTSVEIEEAVQAVSWR